MKYADILRSQVAELESERAALLDELDTIATDETRSADDITARADEITARAKEIGDDIKARSERIDQLDAIEAERNATPRGPEFLKPVPTPNPSELRGLTPAQVTDQVTKAVEERGIDPTYARTILKRHQKDTDWARGMFIRSSEVYAEAWSKVMRGVDIGFLSAEERAAMAVGTNTAGGFIVPTFLDPSVILTNTGSANVIRSLARVVTLTQGNTWKGITSAGITASWDGELTEVSDDSPNDFAQPSIPLYTGRAFAQISFEGLQDIENAAQDIVMMFGDARDRLQGAAHATGNGSTAPTGIFTALDANTNVEIVSTTAATISLTDLQQVRRSVGQRWRGRGAWVMNPYYADAVRALGTSLSASFSNYLPEANSERLLGSRLVETDDAPSTQTTTVRDNQIVFGDFSNYVVVDKPGSTALQYVPVLFNTATNLPDGRSGWLLQWREGADSVNDLGFRLYQDKTSA